VAPENPPEVAPVAKRPRLTSTPRGQAVYLVLWVVGTLGGLAALGGAFVLGQHLGAPALPPVVVVVAEDPQQPELVFPTLTGGPVDAGIRAWNELRGGECLADFDGAFAESFEVVSCDTAHRAQLVKAQLLNRDRSEVFPGEEAIAQRAAEVCELSEVIDRTYATGFNDLVVQYSYPVTEDQWDAGQRVVYCFVNSASGESFTKSLTP
jgi:hypothetical protein